MAHTSTFVSWSLFLPTPLLAWGGCKIPHACSHTHGVTGEGGFSAWECNTWRYSCYLWQFLISLKRCPVSIGVIVDTQSPAGFPPAVVGVMPPNCFSRFVSFYLFFFNWWATILHQRLVKMAFFLLSSLFPPNVTTSLHLLPPFTPPFPFLPPPPLNSLSLCELISL